MPSGRVLVIDDEADVVAIIRRYLIKEGLCVQGVTDNRQVEMDGIKLVSFLPENDQTQKVSV